MNDIDGLLRLPQVMALTTLSRSEIYRRIQDGSFPKQIRMSEKRSVWRASEVKAWIDNLRTVAA